MSTQPLPDPTGDHRAGLLARLEHDLMPWSDRTALAYTEDPAVIGAAAPHTLAIDLHSTWLLSANGRQHWRTVGRITKMLRHLAATEARAQRLPRMQRAHLTVWVAWPDRRRRDVANLAPTLKALIDGVVDDADRLPDDDDKHLVGPDLRVLPEISGLPRTTALRLEFKELP